MKQNDWKIIYNDYSGVAKRAIHLLSKEAGAFLIREPNVYTLYVLPCEAEGAPITKNAFFVGRIQDSELIRKFVSESEVPSDGFLVKIVKNPEDEDGRFVILTAHTDEELFYSVVSFLDDYIPEYAPPYGANKMPDYIFDTPLEECSYTERPENKTRSIFTWGHSISDYRAYIDNMARLKFNELIIWNDFVPLNIREVIEYAHSYGIRVNLGYSWGWQKSCDKITDISDATLSELRESIIAEYEKNYLSTGCDGIYFQSFTERGDEYIGERLIAEAVTTLVNMTTEKLLTKYPDLKLQFGLHASSVKEHLDEIGRVDTRVEILWEDCGEFPYNYKTYVREERYEKTLELTKKILKLRGGVGVGLVFKGVMMMDWRCFVNQRGPYVMGENSRTVAMHDRQVRRNSWREFTADWLKNGERALDLFKFIKENKLSEVNMCSAGTFDGGIYLPEAILAEMYRKLTDDYQRILQKTSRRASTTYD